MKDSLTIQQLLPEDWDRVREIYLEGIATGHATFETASPSWEQWNASHLPFARLVARRNGEVVGWAALSRVSQRCVYDGVAEVSIYVASAARGAGVGRELMTALIEASEQNGIWTLQAGLFPENVGSLALHLGCGFREVGRRNRIGRLNGTWRDTMLLERRSNVTGME
jgi:L-amino acid N-acyltransferase YncA